MLFSKKQSSDQKSGLTLDRQFIFIEAPIDLVGPEAMLWGESSWWPPKSVMQFKRIGQQALGMGAQYIMILKSLIPQNWQVEVTQYEPGRLVVRTFKKGFFKGFELVRAEERANGTRVEYELHYQISNPINKLFWNMVCHKLHETNINKLLDALKMHCLKKMEPQES